MTHNDLSSCGAPILSRCFLRLKIYFVDSVQEKSLAFTCATSIDRINQKKSSEQKTTYEIDDVYLLQMGLVLFFCSFLFVWNLQVIYSTDD